MYWIFVINPENMKVFAWLLMHVIRLFISILSDFVTSHKITFYSKLYDIDLLENFTHDRTHDRTYVHEFLLSLHQHCFLDKKAPRTTLNRESPERLLPFVVFTLLGRLLMQEHRDVCHSRELRLTAGQGRFKDSKYLTYLSRTSLFNA